MSAVRWTFLAIYIISIFFPSCIIYGDVSDSFSKIGLVSIFLIFFIIPANPWRVRVVPAVRELLLAFSSVPDKNHSITKFNTALHGSFRHLMYLTYSIFERMRSYMYLGVADMEESIQVFTVASVASFVVVA